MLDVLIEIVIIGLVCNGIKITSYEGMIFHSPIKWLKSKLPNWIAKPTISCIYCMASFWGAVIHTLFILTHNANVLLYPVVIFASVYVNGWIFKQLPYED